MITAELFERLFPTKGFKAKPQHNLIPKRQELIDALNKFLPVYEINTHKRVAAFLANCGVETDYFRTTEEYASGRDYEGRKDLGNVQAGDGRRFKGRGLTQTTGRYNYDQLNKTIGPEMGIDFIKDPGCLNLIPIAVESACVFWKQNGLNAYADKKEFKKLSGVVNRGNPNKTPLHWPKRNELYSKCIRYIPQDFAFVKEADAPVTLVGETPAESPVTPIEISPELEGNLRSAADMAKGPNVKIVAGKIAGKVGGPLTAAWATTSGKILLTLTAIILIGGAAYTAYLYRKPIQLGYQKLLATIKKKAGLTQ